MNLNALTVLLVFASAALAFSSQTQNVPDAKITLPSFAAGQTWEITDRAKCSLSGKVITRNKANGNEEGAADDVGEKSVSMEITRELNLVSTPHPENAFEGTLAYSVANVSVGNPAVAQAMPTEKNTYPLAMSKNGQDRAAVIKATSPQEIASAQRDRVIDLLAATGALGVVRDGSAWKVNAIAWQVFGGAYANISGDTLCQQSGDASNPLLLECGDEALKTTGVTQTLHLKLFFEANSDAIQKAELKTVTTKVSISEAPSTLDNIERLEVRECTIETNQKPKQ